MTIDQILYHTQDPARTGTTKTDSNKEAPSSFKDQASSDKLSGCSPLPLQDNQLLFEGNFSDLVPHQVPQSLLQGNGFESQLEFAKDPRQPVNKTVDMEILGGSPDKFGAQSEISMGSIFNKEPYPVHPPRMQEPAPVS